MAILDDNGQPNWIFNSARRKARAESEIIGLCKGILADNIVNESEAKFLTKWFKANHEASTTWPGNVLLARLNTIYQDGIVTPEELIDLHLLLKQMTGLISVNAPIAVNLSSTLPLDSPVPPVVFQDKLFCITGALAFGPRKEAEELIVGRGGKFHKSVILDLDYLVIGVISSRDWKQTTHGNKILLALDYKKRGQPINIISEETFIDAVFGTADKGSEDLIISEETIIDAVFGPADKGSEDL
ncbi:MAG: BRCT domain-containing protein [Deltaproteobacteria bacterium]|nr:BRCT domain-containing protein [Deltaproteobacteria bacterium]